MGNMTTSSEQSPERDGRVGLKVLFTLTLVHFMGDFYMVFLHPLLPVLIERFGLSLTRAGFTMSLSSFLAFMVQPAFGLLADRYRTRAFVILGLMMLMVFIPMVGAAGSYGPLLLFIALGSLGSSMFHPTVAGMVPLYAGRHPGLSMSFFSLGGTAAYALGPLFITWFVTAYSFAAIPWIMIIGLPSLVYIYLTLPLPQEEGPRRPGVPASVREAFGPVWQAILLLWVIMVLRSFVDHSIMVFLPVLYTQQGYSLVGVGIMLSLYTMCGVVGVMLGGHISDKIGIKPVFVMTFAMAAPCLWVLVHLTGGWVYLGVGFMGLCLKTTMPLGVVLAQGLAPKGRSMASSLIMGLAYGSGGLLLPLAGGLADVFSISAVLSFLAFIPLLSIVLIYFMTKGSQYNTGS